VGSGGTDRPGSGSATFPTCERIHEGTQLAENPRDRRPAREKNTRGLTLGNPVIPDES
jgi:hypothetical protein